MYRRSIHRYAVFACVFTSLAALALTACDLPSAASSAPTATPAQTIPGVPAGWQMYQGSLFSVAYPPDWTYDYQAPSGGWQGQGIVLNGPQASEQINIMAQTGLSDAEIHTLCAPQQGETPAHLAGLPVKYTVVEGVYRTWFFASSHHITYVLSVLDGAQSRATQTRHDAILATFRPADTIPGCA